MKVELSNNGCKVTREATDKKIYNESRLLYLVKKELQKQGYDVIKKLMWKDGHMVSDTEHYIRDRKDRFEIWFSAYALRFSYEDYNKGEVIYNVEGDVQCMGGSFETQRANANIIAAAPDMYEALESALWLLKGGIIQNSGGKDIATPKTIERIEQALAKAEKK